MPSSYLYFIHENSSTDQSGVFNVKIGFASHNKTDEAIKNRKAYLTSKYPVTITRRIVQLQTGNPRKIEPIAYFTYQNQNTVREIESYLHAHFENKKSEHSKEWFSLSNDEISDILTRLKPSSRSKEINSVYQNGFWIDEKWNII
jgi:hypothetical protein